MEDTRPMTATAVAPANIALVKYWGNIDSALRLPWNASLSFNLDAAQTTTTVTFGENAGPDTLVLDGQERTGPMLERATQHLDVVRARAGLNWSADITSANSFPMGTGMASSASAFAALTVAACAAAGLELDERALSAMARRGSGSAARSIPAGFVVWRTGVTDEDSFAESIAPPSHWALADVVVVVSRDHKRVGSSSGHDMAHTSPFFATRQRLVGKRLDLVRSAVLERDMGTLGPAIEAEALELHAVIMTTAQPLLYWEGETIRLLKLCDSWRRAGLPVYFTLDAGPNVHLICEEQHVEEVVSELKSLSFVDDLLVNRPAPGARLVEDPVERSGNTRSL